MIESERRPEAPGPKENYSKVQVFEHLFPGCNYTDLPVVSAHNVRILFDLYTLKDGYRNSRFCLNVTQGKSFAEREKLSHPDRVVISYYLRGLKPAGKATHPTLFKNHSFSDLVDARNGEKLGGAATRLVGWDGYYSTKIAEKLGIADYVDEPEYVIGVLDKDNLPCAIIHFGEGSKPRKPTRGKKDTARGSLDNLATTPISLE